MSEEIRLHFERANEYISDAEFLLRERRIASAVGRAYYAMFHAATAVLLSKDIQRSSHHGLISAFGRFIAKPGFIDYEHHRNLQEIFDLRRESDYEPIVDIRPDEATRILQKTRAFVAACRGLVFPE